MISIGEYYLLNLGDTTFNQLLKLNIISNQVKHEFMLKKPDALLLYGKRQPYKIVAIIENKKPEKLATDRLKDIAVKQMAEYCDATETLIGAISDGVHYYWYAVNTQETDFTYIYEKITVNEIRNINGRHIVCDNIMTNKESQTTVIEIIKSIDKTCSIVREGKIIVNPTSLAKSIWQSIWLATGDDPKMCLMTFTEIFMYKYLSDLELIEKNDSGVNIAFNDTYKTGKTDCLKFYINNVRPYIKTLFKPGEDGSSIINGLSLKASRNQDELFYNILTSFKNYGSLKNVSIEFKSSLFEEFLKGTNGIKLLAQFFTPRNIIRTIINMAQINKLTADQQICDPACGVGGFILESMIARNTDAEFFFDDNETFTSCLNYYGFDIDYQTIVLAKASLTILLSDYIKKYKDSIDVFYKFINKIFLCFQNSPVGSLSNVNKKYDLILSNPPYVRKGLSSYHEYISNNTKLVKFYDVKTASKEGLFLLNIIKNLKPNGRAFVILPDGFFHTRSDSDLRNYLINECFIDGIISLPARTFYTTAKKTYILCLTKKQSNKIEQSHPVFNYIVQDVGESLDAARTNTSLEDLNTLANEFKLFYLDPHNYKSNNIKILLVPINHYEIDNMWLSERLYTEENRIKLNIKDERQFDSIEEMEGELEEVKEQLNETILELKKIGVAELDYKCKEIPLSSEEDFEFISSCLGLKRKEYMPLNCDDGVPLYTAAKNPVAKITTIKPPIFASTHQKHVSVATDGDGTAGTNIILHEAPYYLNTSRIAIKVKNADILPEFLYFTLKDIKPKFGFGYSVKCSPKNFKKYVKLNVPLDEKNNISIEKQKEIVDVLIKREKLLNNIEEYIGKLKEIKDFNKFLGLGDA